MPEGRSNMENGLTNRYLLAACLLAGLAATPAVAENTFQNTCSEIRFAYSGNNPALQAVCLRVDGTPNATSLVLEGIHNENGRLVRGTGQSTFQKSCGNIRILVDNGPNVTLSALCRMSNGSTNPTSLELHNVANHFGRLVQE